MAEFVKHHGDVVQCTEADIMSILSINYLRSLSSTASDHLFTQIEKRFNELRSLRDVVISDFDASTSDEHIVTGNDVSTHPPGVIVTNIQLSPNLCISMFAYY